MTKIYGQRVSPQSNQIFNELYFHQLYSHADFITENYAAVLKKKVFIPSLSNSTYCTKYSIIQAKI